MRGIAFAISSTQRLLKGGWKGFVIPCRTSLYKCARRKDRYLRSESLRTTNQETASDVLRSDASVLSLACLAIPDQVSHVKGRPRKDIDSDLLTEALNNPNRKIKQADLAKALNVHRHTVRRRMRSLGLQSTTQFTAISDDRLDSEVKGFLELRPDSGEVYLAGHLLSKGIHVQRWRIRESIRRVDSIRVQLRVRTPIVRRTYSVARPNALWHLDGYHKLNPYGFVIHGIVDGFSRKVGRLNVSEKAWLIRVGDRYSACMLQRPTLRKLF